MKRDNHKESNRASARADKSPLRLKVENIDWQHHECLYIPGKVAGQKVQYLVDTGCSDNVLSRALFNQLPRSVQAELVVDQTSARMADGTGLLIYGSVTLPCRIRTVQVPIPFRVANITDDAILGMRFLNDNKCSIVMDKGMLLLGDQPLACVDRTGHPIVNRVQVVQTTTIVPGREAQLICRVTTSPRSNIGLIEHFAEKDPGVLLAATVAQTDAKGRLVARCLNTSSKPVTLNAGAMIGVYTPLSRDQIYPDVQSTSVPKDTPSHVALPQHVEPLFEQAATSCETPRQRRQLANLLLEYSDVFSCGDTDVGRTNLVSHSIPVEPGTHPVRQAPRRLGAEKDQEVERQVGELVDKGLVEPADSAWSSPVVLVKKKDGSWRLCVDYRQLNAVTRKDAYPLPRIDDSLDALSGSAYFSTLDLVSGYWQVPLDQDAQEKAAFTTRGGLWKWRVLPFGLTSAPATFERLMEQVLKGLQWKSLLLYLDDVIVFSPDFETHLDRLGTVFARFRQANLKLKPSKCELLQQQVRYLGHVVSSQGVSTDPEKIKAIKEWQVPRCQTEVRTFLGFMGYYRRFCQDYATVAKPLTVLTAKGAEFVWGAEQQGAFDKLRLMMMSSPVLAYPDMKLEYILDTDASLDGVGAVLSQVQGEEERVIAYYSKTLGPAERNYCVTRRELLAIVMATKHFRPYLYGRKFRLRTDHASLQWLYRRKEPSHQVARWLELLAEFHFVLEHRAGERHGNADGMSRCSSACRQCSSIVKRDGGPHWAEMEVLDHVEIEGGSILKGSPGASVRESSSALKGSGESSQTTKVVVESPLAKEVGPLQHRDGSDLAKICELVQNGSEPSHESLTMGSDEFKRLAGMLPQMTMQDGILRVRLNINDKHRVVIVCPIELRPLVIREAHLQAHSGVHRTYRKIRLTWYWPGMSADVRRAIRNCEICQVSKHGQAPKSSNQQHLYAGRPWQTLSLDLVGPFVETPRGNTMILVIADHFTKWRDAVAIPDGTTTSIVNVLERQVFNYFGLPERLHTDRGAQFESQLMEELCAVWGIQKTRTTPYHPQGNGVVERGNKDLGDALRSLLLNRDESDWDLLLPQIMRSIRSTPHSVTGETPNFLMFGRELSLPDILISGKTTGVKQSQSEYARDLHKRLEEAFDKIRSYQDNVRAKDTQEPPL